MRKKQTLILGLIIAVLAVAAIGGTYAFFIASTTGTNQTVSVQAGTMALTFADVSTLSTSQSMSLGDSISIKFSIENTGNNDAYAKVLWKNLVNTYQEGSLTYSLGRSTTSNGTYTDIWNGLVPRSATATSDKVIRDGMLVEAGEKYYYQLTINFVDTGVNQDADKSATFRSEFTLENGSNAALAIYIPNATKTAYVQSSYTSIAEAIAAGYEFNESESSCTNGATLTYNSANNTVSVTTTSATTCDFKFDEAASIYAVVSKASSSLATGDKIAIGDENFWVISNTNGTIRALAEYNINVGSNKNSSVTEGLQDESVKGWLQSGTIYGNVAFDSSSSTYAGSAYEGYINSYINLLVSTYGLNASDISGDAITKTELETLGCDSSNYTCSGSTYPWVYTTSYWSGSALL